MVGISIVSWHVIVFLRVVHVPRGSSNATGVLSMNDSIVLRYISWYFVLLPFVLKLKVLLILSSLAVITAGFHQPLHVMVAESVSLFLNSLAEGCGLSPNNGSH